MTVYAAKTEETEINWPVLDEALDWITENRQRWDQSYYMLYHSYEDEQAGNVCNTNLCLAGTICMLNDRIKHNVHRWSDGTTCLETLAVNENGHHVGFHKAAKELLGITQDQSYVIFNLVPTNGATMEDWRDPEKFREFVVSYLKGAVGSKTD